MINTVPVTVVVPCFDCESTIQRAIASVTQQTHWPESLILVDDASTDATLATLRGIQDGLPKGWVQVIALQVNQGAASARNAGWDRAKTPFVAFLDADDTWHPDKLATQYRVMVSQPQISVTGHRFVQAIHSAPIYPPCLDSTLQNRRIAAWQVLLKNPFITPSLMVRTDTLHRFAAGQRYMEDHLLLMQMALKGCVMSRIEQPLACIHKSRYGESGLSAHLDAMHQAELANLKRLTRDGDLNPITAWWLSQYARMKFWRRCMLVALRRMGQKV